MSCDWNCRLKPFHVKLIGVRRSPWGTNPADAPLESDLQQTGSFQDLHGLLNQADLVVLTCSQTELTKGMVNSAFLQACKPGVRVINVARGDQLMHAAATSKTYCPLLLTPCLSAQTLLPLSFHPKTVQHVTAYLGDHQGYLAGCPGTPQLLSHRIH